MNKHKCIYLFNINKKGSVKSMMYQEIENRMVVDSEWPEEKDIEPGYFSKYGTFVKEEHLLEVAFEEITKDSIIRNDFLENFIDYIESNKNATKKFLAWFYPEYDEEE